MKHFQTLIFSCLILGLSQGLAFASDLSADLLKLQQQWAKANYQLGDEQTEQAFADLTRAAMELEKKYPGKAEPLVWHAIILSTDAGKHGGLSALSKVKEARDLLLEAEKIDPNVLDGSIYTSLGSLYFKVPGWPLAFGDDEQAEKYLQKALAINPDGMDSNYFYADFLIEKGRYDEARKYLNKALRAPRRPRRPLADAGRLAEVKKKIAQLDNQ